MIRHLGLKASSNISVRAPVRPSVRSFVRRLMPQFIINGPGFTSSRQAGSGHQISIMQPKLAGCSQWSEANIKQRSFHFQWAIMQQHLDEGPYETLVFFLFFFPPCHKALLGYINVDPPHPLTEWKGHSCLFSWHAARKPAHPLSYPLPPSLPYLLMTAKCSVPGNQEHLACTIWLSHRLMGLTMTICQKIK